MIVDRRSNVRWSAWLDGESVDGSWSSCIGRPHVGIDMMPLLSHEHALISSASERSFDATVDFASTSNAAAASVSSGDCVDWWHDGHCPLLIGDRLLVRDHFTHFPQPTHFDWGITINASYTELSIRMVSHSYILANDHNKYVYDIVVTPISTNCQFERMCISGNKKNSARRDLRFVWILWGKNTCAILAHGNMKISPVSGQGRWENDI